MREVARIAMVQRRIRVRKVPAIIRVAS
jgi:hypothetical protein